MQVMSSRLKDVADGMGGAFLIALAIITPFLRSWSHWGATADEVSRVLPGDEFVPHGKGGFTQAITIRSRREKVWPWVAQIGQGRGGFYSYDFLENLIGCRIHSADEIVPAYRHDEKSDGLRLHPDVLPVPFAAVEPGRTLLFAGRWYEDEPVSWVFTLVDAGDNACRLVSRWVSEFKPGLANTVRYRAFIGPISVVMGRKMLLGIKKRAEGPHGLAGQGPS